MQKIRFGDVELKALFALEEKDAGILTLAELAKMLRLSKVQSWKLASRLVRKNRLIRLKRGIYLFAPMKSGRKGLWTDDAYKLLPKLMGKKDYYVGFWTALNYYGLTEQIPVSVQVVTTSRQRSFEALQSRFYFIQVKKLGQWQEEKIGYALVKFATIEQLMLDCLTMPENCGGIIVACQALWEARKRINWEKLEELAANSNDAARRRLGYLCELLKIHKFKAKKPVGWRWLDSSRRKEKLGASLKWGLILNYSEEELTQWRDY